MEDCKASCKTGCKAEEPKKMKSTVYPSGMDSHGISSPKSVERTRKELDTSVMYHNTKRKHGTDINSEVYQVPGDFRKYQEGYENIEWDKDDNNGDSN
ncbi:MAG: hypothetical protein ACXABD_12510 [Candidatus Thorarchaeota archaeon]|jgi:hypothetical protein